MLHFFLKQNSQSYWEVSRISLEMKNILKFKMKRASGDIFVYKGTLSLVLHMGICQNKVRIPPNKNVVFIRLDK